MRIQSDQLVSLGYGKYVRSDEVAAVEPITEGRGPGRRSLVWLRGVPEPLIASRAEGSIVDARRLWAPLCDLELVLHLVSR